jgi:hypothetical protein
MALQVEFLIIDIPDDVIKLPDGNAFWFFLHLNAPCD